MKNNKEIHLTCFGVVVVMASIMALVPPTDFRKYVNGKLTHVDGDSITIGDTPIRLDGVSIYPPDKICTTEGVDWYCGRMVNMYIKALGTMTEKRTIDCVSTKDGMYDCYLYIRNTRMLNFGEHLVRYGIAKPTTDKYAPENTFAQGEKLGIYAKITKTNIMRVR